MEWASKSLLLSLTAFLFLAANLPAAPIDDLKAIRQLPMPLVNWGGTPPAYFAVGNPELTELTRITGNIAIPYETTKWRILVALSIGQDAQAKRLPNTAPVFLVISARPWLGIADVHSVLVPSESVITATHFARINEAISESTWNPQIVCTVDAETFGCRGVNQEKCSEVYADYDALLRAQGCSSVHWYGFGYCPAPGPPDEFSLQPWAAPFPGLESIGFQLVFLGEQYGKRIACHKNRAYAQSLGVSKTMAWIAAPGCGRKLQWGSGSAYWPWVWSVGEDTVYDAQLGRELFGSWQRRQGTRYMGAVDGVAVYPALLDARIVDSERKHLLAFLRGASE